MASFAVTYNTMLKHDIKHTYFGRPSHLQFRGGGDFPTFEQLRRIRENRALRQKIIKGRVTTYYQRDIPDAPAFRIVSRHSMDDIVERLRTPTIASRGIKDTSESMCVEQHQQKNATKPLSPRDQEALVARLSTPTHMSRMRAEMEPYNIIKVLNKPYASNSLMVDQNGNDGLAEPQT